MEQLIDKIWSYGQLSAKEKRDVEAHVLVKTEYAPLLEDSKALHALLSEAGIFAKDSVDAVALAYLVAHNQIALGIAPGILDKAYKQLQHKIETMPNARERYVEVQVRMEEIAMNSDPMSQFEQLTGYDVQQDYVKVEESRDFKGHHYAQDRPTVKNRARHQLFRWGVRSNFFVAVSVLLLFLGFYNNRIARNAYTSADVLLVNEIVEERGLDEFLKPVSPDVVLTFAQRALYESQKVWLGVYYFYDEEGLKEAEELLLRVRHDASSSSYLIEESTYLLAKVYLAQKDFPEATSLLDELIAMRSRRLDEAVKLKSLL